MENKEVFKFVRHRDFLFFLIIITAIYVSLDFTSFNYRLQPAWYYDQRLSSEDDIPKWKQLPPLIVDLEGDDRKEIVLITKDLFLKIFRAEPPLDFSEDIYAPLELKSTPLSNVNKKKFLPPVAIKTGYIEEYNDKISRKQVIIIVREDLTVLCYDESLELLWEKQVAHNSLDIDNIIDKFSIDQIDLIVSPISLRKDSMGAIILGVSMKVRSEYENLFKIERGIDMSEIGEKDHPEMEARSKLEHFNIFALDAHTGHIIWRHDGHELRSEQYTKSLPEHAFKLEARELSRQLHGKSEWTVFRQSLTAELPHDWHTSFDTSLNFAHFVRKHIGADAGSQLYKNKKPKKNPSKTNKQKTENTAERKFVGIETPPLSMSASLPHDALEHTEYPNVIVAHTKKGLDVISIKTGLPITSLALNQGQSYADINGDGIIDSILLLEDAQAVETHAQSFAHEGGEIQTCSLMVISGLPPKSQLFNGSLCLNQRSLQDPIFKRTKLPSIVTATSPLILKSLDPKTMRESKIRDIVVSINTGITSCYDGNGEFKWQNKNSPVWSLDSKSHYLIAFDSDSVRADELGTHDNRHAQILVLGDKSIALLSREGLILTKSDVPNIVTTRPVIGDFDNDLITDVVLVTDDAILAYRLEITASTRGVLIAFIILSILALVVFISTLRSEIVLDSKHRQRIKLFSGIRSTDEYHID